MIGRGAHKGDHVLVWKTTNGSGKKFYINPANNKRTYLSGQKTLHCARYPGDLDCPGAKRVQELEAAGEIGPADYDTFYSGQGFFGNQKTRQYTAKQAHDRVKARRQRK